MSVEWQRIRFAEICEHSAFGPRFSGELYATDGNVATLRTTDISEDGRIEYATMPLARLELSKFQQHILREDDLVITRSGRVGTTAVFKGFRLPVLPGAFLIRFRLKRELADPEFYRYFFNSFEGQNLLLSVATGSVQQNLNITSLHELPIPVPPLPEQGQIAAILGSLDDKIELNRRENETLEAIARALFKSWFVDFDPVRAKAEGRQPAGMDAETAALFPNSFEDSPLGEIPRRWSIMELGNVISIFDSKRIPLSSRERAQKQGNYPYYGAASVMDYVDEYIFDGTYILMGEDGSVVDDFDNPVTQYVWGKFWVNNHAHVLKGKTISDEHLLLFLQQVNIRPYITGAVQPKLNQENMKRVPFTKPSTELCKVFTDAITPLYGKLRSNIEQSRTLAITRDTLLPKLLSGEIRVGELAS